MNTQESSPSDQPVSPADFSLSLRPRFDAVANELASLRDAADAAMEETRRALGLLGEAKADVETFRSEYRTQLVEAAKLRGERDAYLNLHIAQVSYLEGDMRSVDKMTDSEKATYIPMIRRAAGLETEPTGLGGQKGADGAKS